MSNLVPRISEALDPVRGQGGVSRRGQQLVQRAGEEAMVESAEILATEWVADVAMGSTARVTAEEIHYSRELPDYAYRFRRIGDLQALSAARKVQEAGS